MKLIYESDFKNERIVDEYKLMYQSINMFVGTENQCYMTLQNSQSQSADFALKNGYSITKTGKQIPDSRITVTIARDANHLSHTIEFEYNGSTCRVLKNAVFGTPPFEKGKQIDIDAFYAWKVNDDV